MIYYQQNMYNKNMINKIITSSPHYFAKAPIRNLRPKNNLLKFTIIILTISCFINFTANADVPALTTTQQLTAQDINEITRILGTLESGVNRSDFQKFNSILSTNPIYSSFTNNFASQLNNKEIESFDLDTENIINKVNVTNLGTVEVKTRFTAEGNGWHTSGTRATFEFENSSGKWLLADSNLHEKVGTGYILKTLGIFALIALPLFIAFFAFWIWILIDALQREHPNKITWIVSIFIFQLPASIIYYLLIKRKNVGYFPNRQQNTQPQQPPTQQQ